jgi:dihydroorotate dehydrogenase electron transfer subunit
MSRVDWVPITENKEIAANIYKMQLLMPISFDPSYPVPLPGQFVNVYLNDESRLLPRPLSVCDWHEGMLTLVYAVAGEGTRQLSQYKSGTKIRVSSPLGKGYNTENVTNALLVGGGVGIPPLLYLAKELSQKAETRAVLGFRSEPFLTDDFPCPVDIATDDGSAGYKGTVLDVLNVMEGITPGTHIFACGPKPMLKALAIFAQARGLPLQISLEERMGCGYGACVGCVCKTSHGNRKVCEDGPVFNGNEVVWDA